MQSVAFIGLGHMGEPMAARLVSAGFDLRLYDRRSEVVASFVHQRGGYAATSLSDALAGADAAITMLPDDDAVRAVMAGPQGVSERLRRGAIAIDMGTSSPACTLAIGAELTTRGIAYVDAPVMGGVPFARDGTLDIMVGGPDDAVERCLPLFAAMGRKTWRCGASGAGHALKAIANFVNAATFVTVIEALTMGRKCGMSSEFLAETLTAMCAGRQHPLEKKVVPHVLTRRFGTGMAMGLIAKDVAIAAAIGEHVDARHSIATHTAALWREASERYGPARDQAEVVRLWEDDSGVEL